MNQNKVSKNHVFPKVNAVNILKKKVLTDILFPTAAMHSKTCMCMCVYIYKYTGTHKQVCTNLLFLIKHSKRKNNTFNKSLAGFWHGLKRSSQRIRKREKVSI